MAMTALNTQPVQTHQMGGAPMMQPATADILLRKKKKKPEPEAKHEMPPARPAGPPTADILMRRKK